jgi:anthranilate synthase component 1
MAYDLVREFERLPNPPPDALDLPVATLLLCDRIVACDHLRHRLLVIVHPRPGASLAGAMAEAERAADDLAARLSGPPPALQPSPVPAPAADATLEPATTDDRARYESAVRRAREYIAAGDIFQVVLSRRAHRRTSASPLAIYRALRRVNPSPYMFLLDLPDRLSLVGSSPEVLVRVEDGVVTSRPLAGTRPRGITPEADRALEVELLADPKERAEHVMLVDLARNDVGRVSAYGSVHTPLLMEVERYSHVMHIVSLVQGQLVDGRDALDVLQACFPAGTVSGAPKIRAMEILSSLEPTRRDIYAGAVGYIDFAGNLDFCIAIRTITIRNGRARVQAGAGIVSDSNPEAEYEETRDKAKALLQALAMAETGL